jgi:hypothetical protein
MLHAPTFMEAFKENPVFLSLSILLGTAGFVMLIVALIALGKSPGAATAIAVAAAVAGLLAIGAGYVGSSKGKEMTELAATTPGLSDFDRMRIREQGFAESQIQLVFGVKVGSLPLAGGAVLALLGIMRARKNKT